jgi:hypothetical protein
MFPYLISWRLGMEQNDLFIFRFSDLTDQSFQAGRTKTDAVLETASVSSLL